MRLVAFPETDCCHFTKNVSAMHVWTMSFCTRWELWG